jgi:hypothetical protein
MIKKLLSWSARRSHDVRIQAPLALMVGLLEVFGLGPSVLICYHLWKMGRSKIAQRPLFPKLVKAIMLGVPVVTFYVGGFLGHYLTYWHLGIVALVVNVVYVVLVNWQPKRKNDSMSKTR